jgi:hypothetical protein
MGKIGFCFQLGSNPLVFSKFTSSIKCNGVNVLLVWLEHTNNRIPNSCGVFIWHKRDQVMSRLALCKSHQCSSASFAHHSIRFPITKSFFCIHFIWAFIYGYSVLDRLSLTVLTATIFFVALAQVFE